MLDKIFNFSGFGVVGINIFLSFFSWIGKLNISEVSILLSLFLTIIFMIFKIRNEIILKKKYNIETEFEKIQLEKLKTEK